MSVRRMDDGRPRFPHGNKLNCSRIGVVNNPMSQATFKRNAHAAFFKRCLMALPASAREHDSNRYVAGHKHAQTEV